MTSCVIDGYQTEDNNDYEFYGSYYDVDSSLIANKVEASMALKSLMISY